MSRKINPRKINNTQSILIALEDKKSSRFYFEELVKDKKINVICVPHNGSSPHSVIEGIEKYLKNNLEHKPKKSWIVIDRDSFPLNDFNGTIEQARQKNICVAYSNEAYELWLLLHLKDVTTHSTRAKINKELNDEFKNNYNIEYSKAKRDVYTILKSKQNQAIQRAQKLLKKWEKDEGKLIPHKHNPSTTIHYLVQCLNNFDKYQEDGYPCDKDYI